jgi:GNAT superfamily N-acetyltransferase
MPTGLAHNLLSHGPLAALALELQARPLAATETDEVLRFLAARPVQTVCLAGLARDNGLSSPLNRGTFYGCRDEHGALEGVALLGHATLFEARTDRALAALARAAHSMPPAHMIMGERGAVAGFWQHYTADGNTSDAPAPRRTTRERLLSLRFPVPAFAPCGVLRPATTDELDLMLPVQAELAQAASGVDPRAHDPQGFGARCARRLAQGRTWSVVEDGQLLFKAELQAVTPEVIYLEGIYVAPAARARHFGARCLSQLCRTLLDETQAICLLVNEQNLAAHALYRRVGFRPAGHFDTIFLP